MFNSEIAKEALELIREGESIVDAIFWVEENYALCQSDLDDIENILNSWM